MEGSAEYYCSECGEAPLNHFWARVDDGITIFFTSVFEPLEHLVNKVESWFLRLQYDRTVGRILHLLAGIGFGEMATTFDERDSIRTKALWESAEKLGISLRQYRFGKSQANGIFIATKGKELLVFSTLPRPKGYLSHSLHWMDDKGTLKQKLHGAGLPTPRGDSVFTWNAARKIFNEVGAPLIVKPHKGTRGRHTTLHIETLEELERAFRIGKEISNRLIVEEELQGDVFRVTLVGGKPVAVARRDIPQVVGDGIATIEQMIQKENADPRRDNFSFYPLLKNDRMEAELKRQKVTLQTIPHEGVQILLNDKISRLHGTTTIDVTDEVHPENMQLFTRLGTFLDDPIVGVDFMMTDIARPYTEQAKYGVVECNAMPYIDLHHYPFEGKPRDVAGELWKLCLS